jgi:hypothetical protein
VYNGGRKSDGDLGRREVEWIGIAQSAQRGKAATKQAFNPQISQITQIKITNKNNPKSIGFHYLPSKN